MSNERPVKDSDLDELKREMRSAQWTDWAENNQKSLIAGAVALLIVLLSGGLWVEQDRSQRTTAATIYQQAMGEGDLARKQLLLEQVGRDFSGSTYHALALMQLASVDRANAEVYLNALIAHAGAMEEWVWQARLDLAEIKLAAGDIASAKALLGNQAGSQYEQLRYYLLSQASTDAGEKQDYLQKALDASSVSGDAELERKIKLQMKKIS